MTDDLFPLGKYRVYRDLCKDRGWCEPWYPFVGPEYGANGMPKLLYLGGAAWWSESNVYPHEDDKARLGSRAVTRRFVKGGCYSSPFWRLLKRVAHEVFKQPDWNAFLNSIAWSNLTKTGMISETAPPDSDRCLREMDVDLVSHELTLLKPDFVLCVSGSIMLSTGYELFGCLPILPNAVPKTSSTWFRALASGGKLMWTMHPAYKSKEWGDSVIADIKSLTSH